jgi:hypothetical protein
LALKISRKELIRVYNAHGLLKKDEDVKEEEMETDVQPKIEESPVKAGSSRC